MSARPDADYVKLAALTIRAKTDAERAAIARWLEQQAQALRAEGHDYAPRFTAGYWEWRGWR